MSLTSEMRRAVERLVLRLQAEVGGGYHPDTASGDYDNPLEGQPNHWTDEDLRTIDIVNGLAMHVLEDDIYKVCLEQLQARTKMIADVNDFAERVAIIREWVKTYGEDPTYGKNRHTALVDAVMDVVCVQLDMQDDMGDACDRQANYVRTGCRGVEDYTEDELVEALACDTATTWGLHEDEDEEERDVPGLTLDELREWLRAK